MHCAHCGSSRHRATPVHPAPADVVVVVDVRAAVVVIVAGSVVDAIAPSDAGAGDTAVATHAIAAHKVAQSHANSIAVTGGGFSVFSGLHRKHRKPPFGRAQPELRFSRRLRAKTAKHTLESVNKVHLS